MQSALPWDALVDRQVPLIDLRSDAVTRPDERMWSAMRRDPLDWSRFGDRTVDNLEQVAAELLGVEAALLTPSGTMANTLSLLVATEHGESFLVEESAHVLRSEGDAYRRLAGVSPLNFAANQGRPEPGALDAALEQQGVAATGRSPTLLWLENTHTWSGGSILSLGELYEIGEWSTDRDIHLHVDGARLWNAAVATGASVAQLVRAADSVAVNLAKGLGGPGGALLGGSTTFIKKARQRMIALGGGLTQAGLLAACGLVALSDPKASLEADHRRARDLAIGLERMGASVSPPATNIVHVEVEDAPSWCRALSMRGVLTLFRDSSTLRLVTHRDVDEACVAEVIARWGEVLSSKKIGRCR